MTGLRGGKPHFQGRIDAIQWREWWVLDEAITYRSPLLPGGSITVPAAFCTDFASIPKPLRMLYEPANPKWSGPAVVHDRLYELHACEPDGEPVSRALADLVMFEAMGVLQPTGMLPAGTFTRWMFWLGVSAFGAGSYEDAPLRQEERRLQAQALGRL